MNLILHLPAETEARLRECVTQTGQSLEALVLEAVEDKLAAMPGIGGSLSTAARAAEFKAWLETHTPSSAAALNDSRDSMYDGRGA